MEQAKIYVVVETLVGVPCVVGAALSQENAEILADRLADNVVNTGAIPKVTPLRYDTPPTTEPREIRRYDFRRGPEYPAYAYRVQVLEMLEETNPDY